MGYKLLFRLAFANSLNMHAFVVAVFTYIMIRF